MKASIVTPTLNAIAWIRACVANVAQQGDAVLEHIVVDGGSSDGTRETVLELARRHRHLTLITAPGCNQSAAMNLGTDTAAGEVIGILNVDDHYQPGAVGRGVAILADIAAPAFVAGDCRIFDAARRVRWNRPRDLRIESLVLGWDLAQHPCNPSAYFYHAETHRAVGGYDPTDDFAMDVDFVLSCAARAEMRYVPEHWGNFRFEAGGKTFEDKHGANRRAAIAERHIGRLTEQQRAVVELRRREKRQAIYLPSCTSATGLAQAGRDWTLSRSREATVEFYELLSARDRF